MLRAHVRAQTYADQARSIKVFWYGGHGVFQNDS
jgi:hypothetical protein